MRVDKSKISVKISIDPNFKNVIEAEIEKAMRLTMEDFKREVVGSQTLPKDNGEMEKDTFTVVEKSPNLIVGSLITDKPYARYQYYGMTKPTDDKPSRPLNYQTVNNPNARSKWLEEYEDGEWINERFNENLRNVRGEK